MKKLLIIMMILFSSSVLAQGIDSNTVLMLHADGDDGFSVGDGYAAFDGTGDSVELSDDDSLDMTTAMTISAWIKLDSLALDHGVVVREGGYFLGVYTTGKITWGKAGVDQVQSTIALDTNKWYHIAATHAGGTNTIYINGIQKGQGSGADFNALTNSIYIGDAAYIANWNLNGDMDDIALYNRALDTTEITTLYDDGKIGSANSITSGRVAYYPLDSDFTDSSGSNDGTVIGDAYITKEGYTYTAYGNPTLSSDGKFEYAMDFDGTGDYLEVPDSSDWDFGSGQFTIDFWVKFNTVTMPEDHYMLVTKHDKTNREWALYLRDVGTSELGFGYSTDGTNSLLASGNWNPSADVWYHIAVVRSGLTDTRIYVDGSQLGSTYTTNYDIYNSNNPLMIGADKDAGTPRMLLNGLIDEARISKGIARWTGAFTPPTSAHSADTNTNLLLHLEGDASDSGHNITFNGDADVSASEYKFDGSYHFDGTGDYLSIPDATDWDFGSGDFAIDTWIKFDSFTNDFVRILSQSVDTNNFWYLRYYHPTTNLEFYVKDAGVISIQVSETKSFNLDQWYHIALTRDGDNFRYFIDGEQLGSTTIDNSIMPNINAPLEVGRITNAGINEGHLFGSLDELRISKGTSRWTSAFTPDTVPYNVSSAVDPTYTEFSGDGDTTDFSAVDISAVDDPVLANSYAKVEWKGTFDLDGADLDSAVQFNSNFVRVDSAALAALNAVANITMKGTSYDSVDTYYILKDGAACGDCIKYSANPVKFEVTGFSNYTTGGNFTGIPEFSTMTLGIGLIAVLVGLVLIRRKK